MTREEAVNDRLWQTIRTKLLAEKELEEAWLAEPDRFGFASFEAYVDGRLLKAMKEEAAQREARGLKIFQG